ncbi:Tethering factor for nuclear proteasome sts1 [Batrachochytrium dendrobatidis]
MQTLTPVKLSRKRNLLSYMMDRSSPEYNSSESYNASSVNTMDRTSYETDGYQNAMSKRPRWQQSEVDDSDHQQQQPAMALFSTNDNRTKAAVTPQKNSFQQHHVSNTTADTLTDTAANPTSLAPQFQPFVSSGTMDNSSVFHTNTDNTGSNTHAVRMGELMQFLDKQQLLNLLINVMAVHPDIQPTVANMIPRPTIDSVAHILSVYEKTLADAFPYSKVGPDRSDYSYNRVRPHIEDLCNTILHYLDTFTLSCSFPHSLQHEYPATAFSYLHMATSIVHRLPVWNNEVRNTETRTAVYEQLGRRWRMVVAEVGSQAGEQGKVYGSYMVGEWARNLHLHAAQVKQAYGLGEALQEFKRQLGWIIGLEPGKDLTVATSLSCASSLPCLIRQGTSGLDMWT